MKSSTALLVFAQFLHTGAKLILFVLMTQVGGFEVAGAYTYALAIITPTFILFGLSLRQIFVTSPTDVYLNHFLRIRVVFGFLGIFFVLVVALVLDTGMFQLFLVMAIYRFVESLVDLRVAYFQRLGRVDLMAITTLLLAISTTGVLATVFLVSRNLTLSVAAGSFSGFLLFVFIPILIPVAKQEKNYRPFSFRMAVSTSKNGLFLAVASFALSLGVSVPVLILGTSHDNAAVGAYSAIAQVSAISNILFSSVSQAELRVFADLVLEEKYRTFMHRARKYSWALSSVGLVGAVPMYFFGPEIFSYVFGENFSEYRLAMMTVVLTIIIAPFGFFLDVQLVALLRFSTQTVISVATLAFTALCGVILIPQLGILGATLTLFFTMLIRNIIKGLVVRRIISVAKVD